MLEISSGSFLGLLLDESLDVLLGLAVYEEVEAVEDGGGVGGGLVQPARHSPLHIHQRPLDEVLQKEYVGDGFAEPKVPTHLEYHDVCMSSRPNWAPPPLPLPQASVPALEPKKGGWTTSPSGEGVGGPNSDDCRINLALSTLWSREYKYVLVCQHRGMSCQ